MECKKQENEKECPCVETSCSRHGLCCECVKYHKSHGDLPACLR